MNNVERLRENLAQALITMDWLQAIAHAREILELEPDALPERHLLAQLYLRVSGTRLATVQLQKVVQQAIRARKLWKAVAAQKCLDGCRRGDGAVGAYSHLFTMIVGPAAELAPGRARSFPPVFEQVMPETFELICREMELITLLHNERWTAADEGAGLLISTWGRLWIERGEDSFELPENDACAVAPGEGPEPFAALALENAEALHLPADAFDRFAAEIPGFRDLAGWKEQFHAGAATLEPPRPQPAAPPRVTPALPALEPAAVDPESAPAPALAPAPVAAPSYAAASRVLESDLDIASVHQLAAAEPEAGGSETHLLWDMWKQARERHA